MLSSLGKRRASRVHEMTSRRSKMMQLRSFGQGVDLARSGTSKMFRRAPATAFPAPTTMRIANRPDPDRRDRRDAILFHEPARTMPASLGGGQ